MSLLTALMMALIPFMGAALVLLGVAIHLLDSPTAGLVFIGFLAFGEAITHFVLAFSKSKHARAYSFLAGVHLLAAIVFLAVALETLGFWTLPSLVSEMKPSHYGPTGRQIERLENFKKVIKSGKAPLILQEANIQEKAPQPVVTDELSAVAQDLSPATNVR